jgi:hypothetical protein
MDINSFLETALWSTCGFEDDCVNLDDKYCIDDVSDSFKETCQKVCDDFMATASHLFTEDEIDRGHIEHDLWLTMHGHGAGFWDGDYENGEQLTEIAKQMGELEDALREDLHV